MATSGVSNYLAAKLLDQQLGSTSYSIPGTVYLALFTAAPTEAGGGTEVSGGSYTRVSITNDSSNWASAVLAGGLVVKSNAQLLQFTQASASWGSITSWGLYDANSSGNLLWFGTVSNDSGLTVGSGDTFRVPIGFLSITLSAS
jgi:hypothetical protein